MSLCHCGCGQEARNIFIQGHNSRVSTQETRNKISCALKGKTTHMKGKKHTLETKDKMAKAHRGKIFSDEHRKKLSIVNTGKRLTNEAKAKISLKNKGRVSAMKGKRHTEETKMKLSISHKGKISAMKGKSHTEEAKMKMRDRKIGSIPWNKGQKGIQIAWNKGQKGIQIAWNKGKNTPEKIKAKMRKPRSEEGRRNIREAMNMPECKRQRSISLKIALGTPAARRRSSQRMVQRILDAGGVNPGIKYSKNGSFFSIKNNCEIKFDSSYEQIAYTILEQLSEVKGYGRCKFAIDYEFKGSFHKYLPDILVEYQSGRKEIIEIKPQYAIKEDKNQVKFQAAEEYCRNNALSFSVWTEKELNIQ